VLTQSKTSFKNFALGSPIDAKKKILGLLESVVGLGLGGPRQD